MSTLRQFEKQAVSDSESGEPAAQQQEEEELRFRADETAFNSDISFSLRKLWSNSLQPLIVDSPPNQTVHGFADDCIYFAAIVKTVMVSSEASSGFASDSSDWKSLATFEAHPTRQAVAFEREGPRQVGSGRFWGTANTQEMQKEVEKEQRDIIARSQSNQGIGTSQSGRPKYFTSQGRDDEHLSFDQVLEASMAAKTSTGRRQDPLFNDLVGYRDGHATNSTGAASSAQSHFGDWRTPAAFRDPLYEDMQADEDPWESSTQNEMPHSTDPTRAQLQDPEMAHFRTQFDRLAAEKAHLESIFRDLEEARSELSERDDQGSHGGHYAEHRVLERFFKALVAANTSTGGSRRPLFDDGQSMQDILPRQPTSPSVLEADPPEPARILTVRNPSASDDFTSQDFSHPDGYRPVLGKRAHLGNTEPSEPKLDGWNPFDDPVVGEEDDPELERALTESVARFENAQALRASMEAQTSAPQYQSPRQNTRRQDEVEDSSYHLEFERAIAESAAEYRRSHTTQAVSARTVKRGPWEESSSSSTMPHWQATIQDRLIKNMPQAKEVKRDHFVGLMYAKSTSLEGEVNVGIAIDEELRGTGIGTRALTFLLGIMFDTVAFHRVQAQVPDNACKGATMKMLLNLGFSHEGIRRKAVRVNDVWADVTNFGILDTEWLVRHHRAVPKSLWDELFTRHAYERDQLQRWERSMSLRRQSSTETLRGAPTASDAKDIYANDHRVSQPLVKVLRATSPTPSKSNWETSSEASFSTADDHSAQSSRRGSIAPSEVSIGSSGWTGSQVEQEPPHSGSEWEMLEEDSIEEDSDSDYGNEV